MQDEITKHTKKIYNEVKNPKHTFGEKIKEIIIEIFIIVFAVTLSIWLHSWSEHRHQQEETAEFLADLKDDLNKDVKGMENEKKRLTETIGQYTFFKIISTKQIDSINTAKGKFNFKVNSTNRKTNDGNYEGFKSSGKIGFIENKKLKKLILEYYQESMPSAEEAEKYHNLLMNKLIDLSMLNGDNKKLFLNPIFKTSLEFAIQSANNNINGYNDNIKQAKEIIADIDKEEKE